MKALLGTPCNVGKELVVLLFDNKGTIANGQKQTSAFIDNTGELFGGIQSNYPFRLARETPKYLQRALTRGASSSIFSICCRSKKEEGQIVSSQSKMITFGGSDDGGGGVALWFPMVSLQYYLSNRLVAKREIVI